MRDQNLTTGRVYRGLLADSVNVLVGCPIARWVKFPPVPSGNRKPMARLVRSMRSQLAFMLCVCMGNLVLKTELQIHPELVLGARACMLKQAQHDTARVCWCGLPRRYLLRRDTRYTPGSITSRPANAIRLDGSGTLGGG